MVGHITPLTGRACLGADDPTLEGVVRRQTIVLVAPLPCPGSHQSTQHGIEQVAAAIIDELAFEATCVESNLLRILAVLE